MIRTPAWITGKMYMYPVSIASLTMAITLGRNSKTHTNQYKIFGFLFDNKWVYKVAPRRSRVQDDLQDEETQSTGQC